MGTIWGNIIKQGSGIQVKAEDKGKLRTDITADEIEELMKQGIVHFRYKKKDGSLRDAYGTKNKDVYTSYSKEPNGGYCPPKEAGYTTYYDLEKQCWRVFWYKWVVGVYNEKIYSADEFEEMINK